LSTIKKRISQRKSSPLEVIDQAIDRMFKAYETSINDLFIVRKEVYNFWIAYEKEKQKRS
jgi:hypothetical protein